MNIDTVAVTAHSPMTQIGITTTIVDTTLLRSNPIAPLSEILAQNTTLFIKSYGRATLSTASFRGTSPSHTQVFWNGIRINSPLLGMVDFSMIPSGFVDRMTVLHGGASLQQSSGGMGGTLLLDTQPLFRRGAEIRYVQSIGSFATFDELAEIRLSGNNLESSTRLSLASSRNDFRYTNLRKKIYINDDEGNLVDSYHPVERNRNGEFRDLNLLQEFNFRTHGGNRISLGAWLTDSQRGVPVMNIDYRDSNTSKALSEVRSLRAVASWERLMTNGKCLLRTGWNSSDMRYAYWGDMGDGNLTQMIDSRTLFNSLTLHAEGEWAPTEKFVLSATLSAEASGVEMPERHHRIESSAAIWARYRLSERLGAAAIARQELIDGHWSPTVPALYLDYLLFRPWGVVLKASAVGNFRSPTLNDLYYQPGGNPNLSNERGLTFETAVGLSFEGRRWSISGEAALYDSQIRDWILWLGTQRGFWTAVNIERVHSYGAELKAHGQVVVGPNTKISLSGFHTITHAINNSAPSSAADRSQGKQIVYIPVHTSALTAGISIGNWSASYKWNHVGERFTTTNNDVATLYSRVEPYFLNDITASYAHTFRWGSANIRLGVNNLFDRYYETVLFRPMPGRNYSIALELRWKKFNNISDKRQNQSELSR